MCAQVAITTVFFFFNDTAPTETYTLSLHAALPISVVSTVVHFAALTTQELEAYLATGEPLAVAGAFTLDGRSEEHTSELQSQSNLVCRLLLEKKKSAQTAHRLVARHSARAWLMRGS